MIKSTELRQGNKMIFRFKTDSIPEEKVIDITLRDLNHIDRHPEFYKPIPLTEEWLVKFGFEKSIYHCDIYELNKNGFEISFDFKDRVINGCYLECIELDIKYVHQLQNLYFALIGKELTIKN